MPYILTLQTFARLFTVFTNNPKIQNFEAKINSIERR